MSETPGNESVVRLLRLLADRLESHLEGDEAALETLAESLEEGDFSSDDLEAACLVLRSLGREPAGASGPAIENAPGREALRVPSAEERAALSPEAWGYLLALRGRGSLTPGQFERVLERLGEYGVRPVDVELVREVATRVALQVGEAGTPEILSHGEFELPH